MTLTMKVWDWQSESDLDKICNSCFYSLSVSISIQWWSKLKVTFLLFRTSFKNWGGERLREVLQKWHHTLETSCDRRETEGWWGWCPARRLACPQQGQVRRTTCLELSAHHKINLLEHVLYCAICCYLKTNHKRQVYRDRSVGLFKYCAVKKLGVHYC